MMQLATLIGEVGAAAPAVRAWLAACEPAATTLVTAIWQGAVLVCGLEIALRLMPRISAAHRFAVWAAGFAVAMGLPWLPLLHLGASDAGPGVAVGGSAAAPLLQLDARWVWAIAVLWAGASTLRAASLVVHSVRLRRLWKAARPTEVSEALKAALRAVRGGRVVICTTEALDRPSVIGFLSPRILIPEWLMARLTPGELEQIVLHEAEHLHRCDDWTNLMQKLALVAFPLNPALAWIERRLCREREMACDEGVVRITNAPRAYAACLASLAERGLQRRAEALSLGAWHRRSELVHRVHGILWGKRRLGRVSAGALLGTIGCALLAGSVEMSRCPQLVAFVPKQENVEMAAARQPALPAIPAEESAEAKVTYPAGFRAVPAKAVMPVMNSTCTRKQTKRSPWIDAQDSMRKARVAAPSQQVAKAAMAGDRVNPGTQQQWVVLAAWEEVQTVRHTALGTTSDYETGAVAEDGAMQQQQSVSVTAGQGGITGQSASKTPSQNQMNSQYTVTRLILRVVPANPNSNSIQPMAGMVHGGWFVIQL